MAHLTEDSIKLKLKTVVATSLPEVNQIDITHPAVYLMWLPFRKSDAGKPRSQKFYAKLTEYCDGLNHESTICILTTPADAALLLPFFERNLKFQLWAAVRTTPNAYPIKHGQLPHRHAALIFLTRYKGALRHAKTRIKYTYCPACLKTTKDYGGKKQNYNSYGTLLSDVWRDIECDPCQNISTVTNRLCDLFGLYPYKDLKVFDFRQCTE